MHEQVVTGCWKAIFNLFSPLSVRSKLVLTCAAFGLFQSFSGRARGWWGGRPGMDRLWIFLDNSTRFELWLPFGWQQLSFYISSDAFSLAGCGCRQAGSRGLKTLYLPGGTQKSSGRKTRKSLLRHTKKVRNHLSRPTVF